VTLRDRYIWPAFAVATILFYFTPLFLPNASIHWDLADVTYPAQKYVAESFHAGKLPFWSPYLNSGTPFLADPQSGAWYPLHWPFFLIGITPRSLEWEIALHTFLALGGTFLLARRLLGSVQAGLMAAVFYAWSGYFAGRSSQLSKFEAASLLPWLLWSALGALETGSSFYLGLAGVSAGLMVLAGDFPSWIFSWSALVLFTIAVRTGWKRGIACVTGALMLAATLGAIVVWPEAVQLSGAVRDPVAASTLSFQGLAAIFSADYWGVITGLYKGPEEMRQFYLYSGLLMIPLFLAGLVRGEKLWVSAALVGPPVVLAFAGTRGLGSAMDAWFIAALGLALTAGSGILLVTEQMKREYLWMVLLALAMADLWFWNMYRNPLTYARVSYEDIYGKRFESFNKSLEGMKQRPFYRLWSTTQAIGLGPANGALLTHTETSYGVGFALLPRYATYVEAVRSAPLLLNDLAITNGIDTQRGTIVENPAPLERVTAPPSVEFVSNRAEAQLRLQDLDPSKKAVVEAPAREIHPQGAELRITNYEPGSYVIETQAPAEFLLKLAVPYHPGWHASIDGNPADILAVDEALCGVFVPAREHRVEFRYEPLGFYPAASVSLIGFLFAVSLLVFPSRFKFLLR
jgi:hypothetical protein